MPDRKAPEETHDLEIVLDISRLLSRIRHPTPTGVDRVELAYARELLRRFGSRLSFASVHPLGKRYGRLPGRAVERFLNELEAQWAGRGPDLKRGIRRWSHMISRLWLLRPRRVPRGGRRVVVQSSPHHLNDERLVRSILRRERAAFVCLVHDLIPIEYPEYARRGGDRTHLKRIATIARTADVIVTNSEATRLSLLPYLAHAGRQTNVIVAHLGLYRHDAGTSSATDRPFFLCLGTIEPRKNHLLLLNIWRDLATRARSEIPRLVIVGRRGWENEQVVDMLDRCPGIRGSVEEHGSLPDSELSALLAGARALLMPSFAEGYGMPVPEALSIGVPVICSDLPSLREAGGDVPDFVDPLDGKLWREMILEYADAGSVRRQAQIDRLASWSAPSWEDHIDTVLKAAVVVAQ